MERSFYQQLLALNGQTEIGPLIEGAADLILQVSGAQAVYLELGTGEDADTERWWLARGLCDDDVDRIRSSISRGIIGEAIATGRTVRTASALLDPRFLQRKSVKRNEIQAVLCCPIGALPPIGVVYLQGRSIPGPFLEEDEQHALLLARQLAPLAERLLARRTRARLEDHTQTIRASFECASMVGRSEALAQVLRQAALIAPLDVPVLITGPSGTGKTALASLISRHGKRGGGPFVELNCAALPESLLESELFGAVRGAHSTATRALPGKLEAAEGGTLFLDEIAELSLGSQAKLLQLLQSGQYYPLGASAPLQADVRLLSATNVDLREAIAQKRFREDLFYRLHVMPLALPSLQDRGDDIPLLVAHFVAEAARRHRFDALSATPATVLACRETTWPGNARQLAHALEAAVIRAHGERSELIEPHHVFPGVATEEPRSLSFQAATRHFQRGLLLSTLESSDWNVSAAARTLELTRAHLYNLIHAHDLHRKGKSGPLLARHALEDVELS